MKIAQIDSPLSWRGGEQQVLYLSQALHAHGYHNVTICQPHSELYQRAGEARLPVHALRVRHDVDVVAAWKLAQYLRREQVDILRGRVGQKGVVTKSVTNQEIERNAGVE